MARRMIDTSMWSNENFAALPSMGRLLLIGIITLADDQGRCKANPAYLRSQIFPYEDIGTADIDNWLMQMGDNGTLTIYTVGGKAYLQLTNWWEYQPLDWARPSEYPAPKGWQDRIRYNAKGNVCLTHNWRTKSGSSVTDNCDSRGVPTHVPTTVPTQAATEAPTQVETQVNKTKLNKTIVVVGDDDHGWQSVVDSFQAEVGMITEGIGEEMKAYFDELGPAMLIDAFKEASRNNVRKWSYVDTILKKWRANGRRAPNDSGDSWAQLNNGLPDYIKDDL